MSNQLLSDLHDVFPPIEISLPTSGMFYSEGILAKTADPLKIRVGTLGILDEYKYKDPFLLVSGNALTHLITHICGDQILEPEELCEIDVEAILIASRIASYGAMLSVSHRCTNRVKPEGVEGDVLEINMIDCSHINPLNIDLHEFILRYGPIQDENRFEVLLPRVGQTVYLKPTPYRTTVQVMRNVMGNRKRIDDLNARQEEFIMDPKLFHEYENLTNLSRELQIQTILDCIYAVKTRETPERKGVIVEDQDEIMAWLFELPTGDHDLIANRITEISEEFRKISLIPYECEKCKGRNEFNLQMNAEILFLAGSEESSTRQTSSVSAAKNKTSFRTPSRISQKLRSTSQEQ